MQFEWLINCWHNTKSMCTSKQEMLTSSKFNKSFPIHILSRWEKVIVNNFKTYLKTQHKILTKIKYAKGYIELCQYWLKMWKCMRLYAMWVVHIILLLPQMNEMDVTMSVTWNLMFSLVLQRHQLKLSMPLEWKENGSSSVWTGHIN